MLWLLGFWSALGAAGNMIFILDRIDKDKPVDSINVGLFITCIVVSLLALIAAAVIETVGEAVSKRD